jgi:hypothetical protein
LKQELEPELDHRGRERTHTAGLDDKLDSEGGVGDGVLSGVEVDGDGQVLGHPPPPLSHHHLLAVL